MYGGSSSFQSDLIRIWFEVLIWIQASKGLCLSISTDMIPLSVTGTVRYLHNWLMAYISKPNAWVVLFFFIVYHALTMAALQWERLVDMISCFEDWVIFNILSNYILLKWFGSSRTCCTCLKWNVCVCHSIIDCEISPFERTITLRASNTSQVSRGSEKERPAWFQSGMKLTDCCVLVK